MTDVQRFTELTGGKWKENEFVWEDDKTCVQFDPNSTYSNPADILNRMKEYCGDERYSIFIIGLDLECVGILENFINDYILNAPALLRKAVEFLEGE